MKRIVSFFCVLCLLVASPCLAEGEDGKDPLNTLDALNRAIVSIYRVERSPSKVTVDEEYDDIINNIAWGNIAADQELVELFTDMMKAYTENRLEEKDRELLRRQYEVQVNRAFLEAKPTSHVVTEVLADTVTNAVNSDGFHLLGNLVAGVPEMARALQANERVRMQARGQEQEYMTQRMAGEWELDKVRIRRFNDLKTSLIRAAWPLLTKYSLPDEYRLTENNLDSFYAFISEKDVLKAIRMGKRLEGNFARYAPFWFYLGAFYMDAGKIAEARKCFDKFEEVNRPISRRDTIAAANARYKIFALEQSETDEARRLLRIIETHAGGSDWNSILFAALQSYQLGDTKKAADLVQQNIDNGFNVPLHAEILKQMRHGKFDLRSVQAVAIKSFKEPSELEKLAGGGNVAAQYRLGETLFRASLTAAAEKWLEKAAANGNLLAEARLFYMRSCSGKKEGSAEPFDKFEELSSQDSDDARILLGDFYLTGCGVAKDRGRALTAFRHAAQNGDLDAQLSLALEEEESPEKSFEMIEKIAEKGYLPAQNAMAICYLNGTGTPNDPQKAFILFQKAAEQGYVVAQYNLGESYLKGLGTKENTEKAFEWLQKSADQGYALAQNDLAFLHFEGIGTQKNLEKAFIWFEKAAEQGFDLAQYNLSRCYSNGFGTEKDLIKSFEWLAKAAEQGHGAAQYELGACYEQGVGTKKNPEKAYEWYKKSADQGYSPAQYELESCYQKAIGTPFDRLKQNADKGNPLDQYDLAFFYLEGFGTQKDPKKAFELFQKSADKGNVKAQYNIAVCYLEGVGTQKDPEKAFEWFQKAANPKGVMDQSWRVYINSSWISKQNNQEIALSQYNLANCYFEGIGTEKNLEEALEWYQEASDQGNANAQLLVDLLSEGVW